MIAQWYGLWVKVLIDWLDGEEGGAYTKPITLPEIEKFWVRIC